MKKTVLITGASSGIGKEFARIFAAKGFEIIITARRAEMLEELKTEIEKNYKVSVSSITMDLSKPGAANELYQLMQKDGTTIGYLINNAGFGGHGNFYERDWEKDKQMINLNVLALTELTRLILPEMINRDEGKILNVASTAGFLPGPLQAVYFATKAYVLSFSQAIAEELKETNITVTALCPGPVDTGFAKTGDLEDTNLFQNAKTPKSVAEIGFKAMMKGKLVKINEPGLNFALNWIVPFAPRRLVLKVSKWLMKKNAA